MKTILLAIMGTSPQVLTETLYAIYQQKKSFLQEIYLITSLNPRNKAIEWLIDKGKLEELKKHYNLPSFKFSVDNILVMKDENGECVYSGREESDQQSIANSIMKIVAKFTEDKNCQIHASIAGGRKTMAFYMGYAMSIYGRKQDVLSHVFVSKEFEFINEFFYPTIEDYYISVNGKNLNAKNAKVTLAEIPFVRMRNLVEQDFINQLNNNSFSDTVDLLNTYKNKKIEILIKTKEKYIFINNIKINFLPKELAFYLWLSLLPSREIKITRQFCSKPIHSASYLKIYSKIANDNRVYTSFNIEKEDVRDNSLEKLANLKHIKSFEKEWLQQVRSKINASFKKYFKASIVDLIEISSLEYNAKLHQVSYKISNSLIIKNDLSENYYE